MMATITTTELIAAATKLLDVGGYRQILNDDIDWNSSNKRLFEDEYNIVGVVVFETCSELLHSWVDYQELLVNIITKYINKKESKSWDGYLVLLTPGTAPSEFAEIEAVRYNTSRLRKIVATGDDMQSPTEVERVIRMLLPLESEVSEIRDLSVLDLLPDVLHEQGIAYEVSRPLIEAYQEQSPLLVALHNSRKEK